MIMGKLIIDKGMAVMFTVCFAAAVIAALVAKHCFGAEGWTIPATGYGVSSVILLLGGAFSKTFRREGGPAAGALGTVAGTLVSLLI